MLIVKMSKTLSANKLSFDFDFDLLFPFVTTNLRLYIWADDRIGLHSVLLPLFIKSVLKSLVILAIWLALSGVAPFFALNL